MKFSLICVFLKNDNCVELQSNQKQVIFYAQYYKAHTYTLTHSLTQVLEIITSLFDQSHNIIIVLVYLVCKGRIKIAQINSHTCAKSIFEYVYRADNFCKKFL